MLFKVAFRNAIRNPRRSLVTAATVAVGAGALLIFQGFNAGVMTGNREHTIRSKYGHGQVTTRGYRDRVYETPWDHWIADGDSARRGLLAVPGVTGVYPRIEFFGLLGNGRVSISGKGIGVDGPAEADFFHGLRIVDGVPLGDKVDGVILGRGLARSLDVRPGDVISLVGSTVRGSVNGLDVVVQGIFEVGLREIDDGVFHVQIATAQELLDTASVEYFALGLDTHESWARVADEIGRRFAGFEARSFVVLDRIWYQQTVDWLREQFAIIRMIILTIVLLGIFNSASTAILERTRELGMLRANGESAVDVMRMLVWEGLIVAGGGAIFGAAGAAAVARVAFADGVRMPPPPGYTAATPVFLEIRPDLAATAVGLAIAAAVAATVIAGVRVVRLSIAMALRAT